MSHTLLLAVGFGLALAAGAGGVLALGLVRPGGGRAPALAVLGLPLFILGLASVHLMPPLWAECTPLTGIDLAVVGGWSLLASGSAARGLAAGLRNLLRAEQILGRLPVLTDHPVAGRVEVLARRLGIRAPAVRVLELDRPLLASGGIREPAIVLSGWVLEKLTGPELEAAVAHELAHLARGSHLTWWVGQLLRDMARPCAGPGGALRCGAAGAWRLRQLARPTTRWVLAAGGRSPGPAAPDYHRTHPPQVIHHFFSLVWGRNFG